jgi:NADH-quinone oxidoreductase subunit L
VLPWLPKVLWLAAFLAAGLTALYMTRLVVMTFFGRSRVEPSVEHHVHESPRSMTVPLWILAAGSTVVGFLGTPSFLGLGPNRFERWLEPVFATARAGEGAGQMSSIGGGALAAGEAAHAAAVHASAGLEWGLMLAALALALIAILIGWNVYNRRPELPERVAAGLGGLYRLVRDKYRVDEAYDAAVVRPLVWTSRRVLYGVVDVRIIDFGVNLVGILARIGSYGVRFIQTGYVQAYAFVLLLGLLAVLVFGR